MLMSQGQPIKALRPCAEFVVARDHADVDACRKFKSCATHVGLPFLVLFHPAFASESHEFSLAF